MKNFKSIVLTGVHQIPARAFISLLSKDKDTVWQIHYLGRKYTFSESKVLSTEYTVFPKLGITFHPICGGRLHRGSLLLSILSIPKICVGFVQSLWYLAVLKPSIIVSFGGYLAIPPLAAAKLLSIPALAHSQTPSLDLSSKLSLLFVKSLAVSFPVKKPHSKIILTGNLLRPELFTLVPGPFGRITKPFIYIAGGNQGAEFLNKLTTQLLPKIIALGFSVIHQVGKKDFAKIQANNRYPKNVYYPFDYNLPNVPWIIQNADLVISRSGANMCQDLAFFAKKAILVPLPFPKTNEQNTNAMLYQSSYPSIIITQANLTENSLLKAIMSLRAMPPNPKPKPNTANSNTNFMRLFYQTLATS